MRIETERLSLIEPLSERAVSRIVTLQNDPEMLAYSGMESVFTDQMAKDLIAYSQYLVHRDPRIGYIWGVHHADELIGVTALSGVFPGMYPHVGYWIGKEYWGKGLMSEALEGMISFAFDGLRVIGVEAETASENTRSTRLLELLDFDRIAVKPDEFFDATTNAHHDLSVYRKKRL